MAREITQSEFATLHAAGGLVLDVRQPVEYVAGHVPGALLVPLAQLPRRYHELPADRPVAVICATGNRSLVAADFLTAQGVEAVSVAGGTSAWQRAGRPVVSGAAVA
ncbi:MAG TPA: rhodanese-like domain-containing protein [Jiangellales bacterium]|nr:rhodanese-like domain-containing protein [Jiangellales bacterium]